MTYLRKIAIAFDQLLNTLFGGWPDETLSSRAYRLYADGVTPLPRLVINTIIFWQKDHCYSAYTNEQKGVQRPENLR